MASPHRQRYQELEAAEYQRKNAKKTAEAAAEQERMLKEQHAELERQAHERKQRETIAKLQAEIDRLQAPKA